jgi:hypothetical protein
MPRQLDMVGRVRWDTLRSLRQACRTRCLIYLTNPRSEETPVATESETGQITGTKDKDYNLIWFTEACMSNALRLEVYVQDAEREGDDELAEFFRKAQSESRKGAEQGKELLRKRL